MKNDFKEAMNEKEALILFYASWCGFSRRFLPTFEEYSKTCPKKCVMVNKEESPELFVEYSIRYYPTVIWFKNGKICKRLDSKPGVGLNKKQLQTFTDEE
ncbi:MAG: thioredoxin family protein [Candidatus Bathyarchaeota archaeon]